MMYSEDDLIPISWLSQYYYCPRRAGLIALEGQWQDNVHTAEGSVLHERVHEAGSQSRKTSVILRGVAIRSLKHGLSGVADCIELYASPNGYILPWLDGKWLLNVVEYKHGRRRRELEYEVQLCAQAMCLEEMVDCKLEFGFIYYGSERRRMRIDFVDDLRDLVIKGVVALFEMLQTGVTPQTEPSAKCRECSLRDVCFQSIIMKSTRGYLAKLLDEACGGEK